MNTYTHHISFYVAILNNICLANEIWCTYQRSTIVNGPSRHDSIGRKSLGRFLDVLLLFFHRTCFNSIYTIRRRSISVLFSRYIVYTSSNVFPNSENVGRSDGSYFQHWSIIWYNSDVAWGGLGNCWWLGALILLIILREKKKESFFLSVRFPSGVIKRNRIWKFIVTNFCSQLVHIQKTLINY